MYLACSDLPKIGENAIHLSGYCSVFFCVFLFPLIFLVEGLSDVSYVNPLQRVNSFVSLLDVNEIERL